MDGFADHWGIWAFYSEKVGLLIGLALERVMGICENGIHQWPLCRSEGVREGVKEERGEEREERGGKRVLYHISTA